MSEADMTWMNLQWTEKTDSKYCQQTERGIYVLARDPQTWRELQLQIEQDDPDDEADAWINKVDEWVDKAYDLHKSRNISRYMNLKKIRYLHVDELSAYPVIL